MNFDGIGAVAIVHHKDAECPIQGIKRGQKWSCIAQGRSALRTHEDGMLEHVPKIVSFTSRAAARTGRP